MKALKALYFKDKFENVAAIEKFFIFPYAGAKRKEAAYRVAVKSKNDNFLYYVAVFETETEAREALHRLSCGTFKEIPQPEALQTLEKILVDFFENGENTYSLELATAKRWLKVYKALKAGEPAKMETVFDVLMFSGMGFVISPKWIITAETAEM